MARGTIPPEAQACLNQASEVCRAIGSATAAVEEQLDGLYERRRELWLDAHEKGASFPEIALACGVSPQLVNREIGKQKGKPWAATR